MPLFWKKIFKENKNKTISKGVRTDLHHAVLKGDINRVRELLKVNHPDSTDRRKMTALHYACQKGFIDIVELLIQSNADVNHFTGKLWTALHIASWARHLDICKLLIDSGADPSIENRDGKTALILSRERGNHSISEYLETFL